MSIRLNKVTRDLNVGISTLVDFLQKKGHVVENNPNVRITEEEYEMLVKEFSQDMTLKQEAERLVQERMNKEKQKVVSENVQKVEEQAKPVEKTVETAEHVETKKPEVSNVEDEIIEEIKPHIKLVGNIDLDAFNKKPKPVVQKEVVKPEEEKAVADTVKPVVEKAPEVVAAKEEKKEEIPATKPEVKIEQVVEVSHEKEIEKIPEPAKVVSKPETPFHEAREVSATPVSETKPESKPEPKTEPKPELKKESRPEITEIPKAKETKVEVLKPEKPEEGPESKEEPEVFTIGVSPIKSNIKVIKKIDLNAINQSTRPRKKTLAEKKKEREEKAQAEKAQHQQAQAAGKNAGGSESSFKKTSKGFNKPDTDAQSQDQIKKKKRSRIKDGKVRLNDSQAPGQRGGQQNRDIKSKLKKPVLKSEISSEDVSKQVKETLARLTSKPKKGAKYRKEKREAISQKRQEDAERELKDSKTIKITEFVTVNDLANMMDVPVVKVISTCMSIGQMVSINQRLDAETINFVADEFGFKTSYVSAEVMEAIQDEEDKDDDLIPRPPIVTVMGHVDHGKTSLLDYVRKTNVIAGEAGGITQHIGAYNVKLSDGRKITFLDTPGHEAFTAMRARGAKVTDIAIIVVAADDDVMPQTVEAINHAAAANVPIVFAINKIDKPGADPDRVKQSLAQMNYLVEDWGGKYQSQEISAKKGVNIKELLEKVLLEAEMLDLKANPKRKGVGSIIESSLDKGRGYVATVLVSNGTLKVGDIVIAGINYGRIKAMFNERGQRIEKAGPSEPALILGLNGAPQAGDNFNVLETEQEAREIANKREQLQREQGLRTNKLLTLAEIGRRIAVGNFKELNIIVKGDVDGSIEALSDALLKLSTEEIQVNVIHKAVGAISESDVTLASASDAIIVGFQVRPSQAARRLADKEGVDMHMYSVIYDAIEEVKSAMEGMLSPEIKEEITATLEVRNVFKITKVGTVAGCLVKEGKIKRGNKLRLIRDGIVIYTGEMGSLKRFKDEVKDVTSGLECGLSFATYQDIKDGDIIESFEEVEVRKSL